MNLYILRLKEGKYYIGTTSKDIGDRLQEHMSGRGSAWTRKYKVLKLEKTIEHCDKYDEDKWTKIYMNRHGITNVRGGSYCEMNLKQASINSISREVSHANDRCLYCNKKGHFIRDCPNKTNTKSKNYSKHLNYLNMSCDYESESDFVDSDGEVWEESSHEYCGAKDGTIYDSELGYIRPTKKNKTTYYVSNDDFDVWSCNYCSKNFNTKSGATCHENLHCNYNPNIKGRNVSIHIKSKKKTNSGKCNKCGRNGHNASNCYAKKHVRGYYLKY